MESEQFADYRAIWESKSGLREVYRDCYRRMSAECLPGKTLEIGGGSGNFKDFRPDLVSTDIQAASWLDAVCNAHHLPFVSDSFANIVMFDVLHHLERPKWFFKEAERILQRDGRIVMCEPTITPVSWFFFTFFHPEPVKLDENPLADGALSADRGPYDSNQGIPTLLFSRYRDQFKEKFPGLAIRKYERFSFVAYPLSGGFRRWSLIPGWSVPLLISFENLLAPLLGPLMAFRMLGVIERI